MKVYELHELKSSKLQYDKKVPRFIFIILLTIAIMVILIVTIAAFEKKTDVIKTTGVISSRSKSYIMSPTGGEIKKVYRNSGDYVIKGDILIELSTLQVDVQIIALELKIEYLNDYLYNIDNFINNLNSLDSNNIEDVENPFQEGEFYLHYLGMLSSLKKINTTKINEFGETVDKTDDEIKSERKDIINQYLSQFYSQKNQFTYELVTYVGQKNAYLFNLEEFKICASETGYVNYFTDPKVGMVIGNDALGTISTDLNNENIIIEGYLDVGDRPFVKVDDNVDVMIFGLPQSEFGVLTGQIESISRDSIITEQQVSYKITVKLNKTTLNKNNYVLQIENGQVGEIRMKYNKTTWLKWALIKIGIIK